MQVFSSERYTQFCKQVHRHVRFTLREGTRVQQVRLLIATLEPSEQSALLRAAQQDQSRIGICICQSSLPDADAISEDFWPFGSPER